MTRFWTIPMLAAAVTLGACSKQTTEAPPPAETAAPAAPAPRPATPARPGTKAPETKAAEPKPLQNSTTTPAVREPAAPPKPTSHEVTVASGTEMPLELLGSLSSETAAVEDEVRARLKQAV